MTYIILGTASQITNHYTHLRSFSSLNTCRVVPSSSFCAKPSEPISQSRRAPGNAGAFNSWQRYSKSLPSHSPTPLSFSNNYSNNKKKSYLHNSEAPIIHGNLSGETIFIQHNGLIKIGSIAPDIVNAHVKTCIDNSWWTKNRHFMAPELHEIYSLENPATTASSNSGSTSASATSSSQFLSVNTAVTSGHLQWVDNQSTPAVDIYSFGMVALEVSLFKKNEFEF